LLDRCAGGELAEDLRHRWRLLEQLPVTDRKIAADHAALTIDQAVGDTTDVLGKTSTGLEMVRMIARAYGNTIACEGRTENHKRDRMRPKV
jgi:hypothetical protein